MYYSPPSLTTIGLSVKMHCQMQLRLRRAQRTARRLHTVTGVNDDGDITRAISKTSFITVSYHMDSNNAFSYSNVLLIIA